MDYKFTYSKFFNVFFHLGVIFNVVLVTWLILIFTGIL
jgi:hypothetical protein